MHSTVNSYQVETCPRGRHHGGQDILKVAILFDPNATTPFSQAMSGISVMPDWNLGNGRRPKQKVAGLQTWHKDSECSMSVQIFFCWSIHTVYSTRVTPVSIESTRPLIEKHDIEGVEHGRKYVGIIDYRVLLNWIVCAQSSEISRWLISA